MKNLIEKNKPKSKNMKNLILTIALLSATMGAMAQNFIGQTKSQIVAKLNAQGIEYETYFTDGGDEGIKFSTETERRIYIIGIDKKCNMYLIFSNQEDFVYRTRTYLHSKGFTESKGKKALYNYKKPGTKEDAFIAKVDEYFDEEEYTVYYYFACISKGK